MTAQIKAELKLVGPNQAGAAMGGANDSAVKEMNDSLKTISRFLKRPSSLFGGGNGGGGLLGLGGAAAGGGAAGLTAAGLAGGAAGLAVVGAFALIADTIVEDTMTEMQRIKDFYASGGVNIPGGPDPNSLTGSVANNAHLIDEAGLSVETRLADETAQRSKYVEELNNLYRQFNDLAKDGLTTEEMITVQKIEQRVDAIRAESVANSLHESRSLALDIEIAINAELLKQKQTMEAMSQISIKSLTKSGRGRETGEDVYASDDGFRGKINQGNLQGKFVGVQVKG